MWEWQLRERLVVVLETAAELDEAELAAAADQLLVDYRTIWTHERRWRNDGTLTARPVHVAGPVIDCVEYRVRCPGFVVDRRQTCTRCGYVLGRGKWACYFDEGAEVSQLGTILNAAKGKPGEVACSQAE